MKTYNAYTIVRRWSDENQNRAYSVREWADNLLYKIPVFVQFEIEYTTPRSSPRGMYNNWFFPSIGIGRNEACDKINEFHWFKAWSLCFSWLGLFCGMGLCVKCAKPQEKENS